MVSRDLKIAHLNLANDDASIWKVPISINYPLSENSSMAPTTPSLWLKTKTHSMKATSRPYIVNVQATGYYRVNYDEENWKNLTSLLKETNHHSIHPLNRAQLIDDIMNLARSHMVNYNLAMDLVLYLKSENNYIPWEAAFSSLSYLRSRLVSDKNSALFKSFILELLEERYQNLGFSPQNGDEEHLTILGRMSASGWMCGLNYEDCVDNANTFFQQWMNNE